MRVALGFSMLLAVSASALALVPGAAPLSQPPCAGASAPVLVAQWDSQLENLAFSTDGTLYVSDIGGDRLLRVRADGAVEVVAHVPGMHGLALGPDGRLFAGASGNGAEVWRFTSLSPLAREVVASGLEAANGLAFDGAGNLFVSSPLSASPPYLVRVPRLAGGGFGAWEAWGDEYGTNGLSAEPGGATLLAAVTADQSSPIVRISTTDPGDVDLVAELSFGALTLQPGAHLPSGDAGALAPKGLDDLTLGPDGAIYAAAHVSGEVLRVDPATGEACVLASGLEEPTSARFAPAASAWAGKLLVTDMGGVGVTALAGPGAGAVWALSPG